MAKIIGGSFGLHIEPDDGASAPPFMPDGCLCLINARSCIRRVIESLRPGNVWCPSYLCHTIIDAIPPGHSAQFYGVDSGLTINSADWLDSVQRGDLVIFIDYFGFDSDPFFLKRAKERDAYVLEGASQALLSAHDGRDADYVVYSPRKFVGVPDGGIVTFRYDMQALDAGNDAFPDKWWVESLRASMMRREFDLYDGQENWFDMKQRAESSMPTGNYAMSQLSQALLRHHFNYSAIARQRRHNYQTLADLLPRYALFPWLPEGVVPLGFPIRLKERDRIRHALFSHGIYPPVHWPIQGIVPHSFTDSHILAREIMTLPCDQRYGHDDMVWMAHVLQEYL